MEEVYTCICGGQAWVIYGDRLKCIECEKEYDIWEDLQLDDLIPPKIFNDSIKEYCKQINEGGDDEL